MITPHADQLALFLEDAASEAFNVRVSHEAAAEAAYQREALVVGLYAKHAGLTPEQAYEVLTGRLPPQG